MKNPGLPQHIQKAISEDNAGEIAAYIQSVNARWSAADCYQSAISMISKNNG